MPDKKISELTSATTPLAGTEVLPIVQSSTTTKVAVSNLTAGRSVSMSIANATLDDAVTNTVSYPFVATHTSTGTTTNGFGVGIDFRQENSTYSNIVQVATMESICTAQPDIHNDFIIKTKYNNTLAERIRIKNGADLVVANGNFVPATAGKGIDFSANTNAAGMTSELLNWYEEGTFTPAYSGLSGGAISYTTQTGRYTRIGRQVTAWFQIVVNTNTHTTGNATIAMPFAANAAGYAGNIGRNTTLRTTLNHTAFFAADANIFLYDAAGGVLVATQITNGCQLTGSTTYFA